MIFEFQDPDNKLVKSIVNLTRDIFVHQTLVENVNKHSEWRHSQINWTDIERVSWATYTKRMLERTHLLLFCKIC